MSGLTAYISEAAAGKKTPQKWLADTVSLLSKCDMATHVGKFTHPDVKVYLQRKNKAGQNAYVLTENVDCETDIVYSSLLTWAQRNYCFMHWMTEDHYGSISMKMMKTLGEK